MLEALLRKIEYLRTQPVAVRNQYAFGTAVSVTLLILLVWGISIPARFSLEPVATTATRDEIPSIAEQFSEVRTVLGEQLDELKTQAELIGILGSTTPETAVSAPTSSLETLPATTTFPIPLQLRRDDQVPADVL